MTTFFPNYLSYVIKLLKRYDQYVSSKDRTKIKVILHILDKIRDLHGKFSMLQNKEGLTEIDQIHRNLRNFRMLLMELEELECFALPIVTHYQEDFDGRLINLLHRICIEIGCPVDPPHVCTLSTGTLHQGRDYYWYYSSYTTIFVPAVERFTLLNLPDLLHELGHHILLVYADSFFEPFSRWFSDCYDDLKKRRLLDGIIDQNRIRESERIFSEYWPDFWKEELVSDLIATYCLGRAYGWTNIKLCQNLPPDMPNGIYDFSETHPPDAYRMEAILSMLKKLGEEEGDIRGTWCDYIDIFYRNKPALYNYYFPDDLIDKIIPHVFQVCNDLGLIPCTRNLEKKDTIIWKLQQAWQFFQSDPNRLDELEKMPL